MTHHRTAALLALVLLCTGVQPARTQSSPDLYQQALRKERTEGDLLGAIALYQRVAKGTDRALAARALVRIGEAYERLGREEAAEAYRRVVREFADQAEPAGTARVRLAAIDRDARPSSNALAARLVWEEEKMDITGRPTPDGRYISFVDWFDTGDLVLHEVGTGRKKPITRDGDLGSVYPLGSSVSRDGRSVAYFWTPPNPRGWQPQLRTIGIDGTGEKVLLENANHEIDYIDPYDWTPDGKHVLVALWYVTHTSQLVLVSTTDGTMRVLKSFDWRRPMRAALSPDGRWIAYDLRPDTLTAHPDLYILAADGSREHHIQHPAKDLHPIWAPDGQHLLFSSDRGGSVGLWALRIVDGVPQGDARLVQGQMANGFYPMDFAGETLFYAQDTGGGNIFTAPFDLASLRVGEPTMVVREHEGYNSAAFWSADASTIAYTSRRGAMSLGQSAWLILRDAASGRETVFDRGPLLHRSFSRPKPSADGRRIAVFSDDSRGRTGLHLVDVASGAFRPLIRFDYEGVEEVGNPQWSRDGRALIYPLQLREPHRFTLVRQDVETGAKQVLLSEIPPIGGRIRTHTALSPDEKTFAYAGFTRDTFRIRVASAPGGEVRELVTMKLINLGLPRWTGITFTPDGKHILFGAARDATSLEVELMAVPLDGGPVRSTGLKTTELRHLGFAPDGRLTFTAGPLSRRQVWTLENIVARLGRN